MICPMIAEVALQEAVVQSAFVKNLGRVALSWVPAKRTYLSGGRIDQPKQ